MSLLSDAIHACDAADKRNYKPVKSDWTVEVAHGIGWRRYPFPVRAISDLAAAKEVRKCWGNYRFVRVKSSETPGSWRKFDFLKKDKS